MVLWAWWDYETERKSGGSAITISDFVMLLAVVAAPLLALQVQGILQKIAECRQRRRVLFESLMATRASRLSIEHVRALNMIDCVFEKVPILGQRWTMQAERDVLAAWRNYLDALADTGDISLRQSRQDNAFLDLLYLMGRSVGFNFDRVHLRKEVYTPIAHGKLEADQELLLRLMLGVLGGERAIPVQLKDDRDSSGVPHISRIGTTAIPDVA